MSLYRSGPGQSDFLYLCDDRAAHSFLFTLIPCASAESQPSQGLQQSPLLSHLYKNIYKYKVFFSYFTFISLFAFLSPQMSIFFSKKQFDEAKSVFDPIHFAVHSSLVFCKHPSVISAVLHLLDLDLLLTFLSPFPSCAMKWFMYQSEAAQLHREWFAQGGMRTGWRRKEGKADGVGSITLPSPWDCTV